MEWISILKCPLTGQDLRLLQVQEIERFNEKIAAGQLWQADGAALPVKLQKAVITPDGHFIYPIINDIVILLKDLAIIDSPANILSNTCRSSRWLPVVC